MEWFLSGSLCGWGDLFIPLFDAAIFLEVPTEIRLVRIAQRAVQRNGENSILNDSPLFSQLSKFSAWAATYDTGDAKMRSRQMHENWIRDLPCAVLRLDGTQSTEDLKSAVTHFLNG
jgi:hypothetical protein